MKQIESGKNFHMLKIHNVQLQIYTTENFIKLPQLYSIQIQEYFLSSFWSPTKCMHQSTTVQHIN